MTFIEALTLSPKAVAEVLDRRRARRIGEIMDAVQRINNATDAALTGNKSQSPQTRRGR